MGLYTFTLEQFHIDNTRSRHQDTDLVVFGLRVGNRAFPAQSYSAGDVNNGDHGVHLVFGPVPVADTALPVVLSYQIFNGGSGNPQVTVPSMNETLASQAVDNMRTTSGDYYDYPRSALGSPSDPFDDASWVNVLEFYALGSFLFPNCDGFVVIGTIGKTKASWDGFIDQAGGAVYRLSVRYPGYDSPAGCGSNSDYTVTWSVSRTRAAGPGPLSLRAFLHDNALVPQPGLRSLDPANASMSVRALMT